MAYSLRLQDICKKINTKARKAQLGLTFDLEHFKETRIIFPQVLQQEVSTNVKDNTSIELLWTTF